MIPNDMFGNVYIVLHTCNFVNEVAYENRKEYIARIYT